MDRIARGRALAVLAVALACVDVHAQANPAARATSSTPRYATQTRVGPAPAERVASGLSIFSATCGDFATAAINAEVEPHIAVNPLNPNHLVGAWQQDRHSNGAARGVVSGVSLDGGLTWALRTLPVSVCSGGTNTRGTDPWVAFSPDGSVYLTVLGVTGTSFTASGVSEIVVARSSDGGFNWSTPVSVIRDAGASFFNDKQAITADPLDARFVYAVWDRLRSSGGGPTLFSRTTNNGATWEPAREIYDSGNGGQTIGNLIRALPDGTLVNLMTVIQGQATALYVIRSSDRGQTWSQPAFVSTMVSLGASDPTTGVKIRDGAIIAQMAVAPDGTLYAVWQDSRFTQQRDAIALSRSKDGGLSWTVPVRINSNPNVVAFTPQVHVRHDGVVGVTYYDLRSDTPAASLPTDFWIARSVDGETWSEAKVSETFDMTFAPQASGQYFLGDYTGLVSAGPTFIAFFGKANASTTNRSDIFATRIAAPTPTLQGFLAKEARVAMGYRAEAMADGEPPRELQERAWENVVRVMKARVPGWSPP
jgi:hypothetical protein